ncbi:tyrosine-type recombinase/integrase [Deferrisoma palaeochoriense]
MRGKLTDTQARRAPVRDRRYELRDGGGLALWVYPTGRKSWIYVYSLTEADGVTRRRRVTLGEYPAVSLEEARQRHRVARELVRQGKDPRVEHERQKRAEAERRAAEARAARKLTVAGLAELYLKVYAKQKKSHDEQRRLLRKDVLPRWGHRLVEEVERTDVSELLDQIVARGAPVVANRARAVLSRMFRWARARGYIETNPVESTEPPAVEKERDRVLGIQELRLFWHGLDRTPLSHEVRTILRLILVTAQRPGEVAGMRYEELSRENGMVLWTIPGTRRKKGDTHVLPLPPLALDLIGAWEGLTGPVFPSPTDPEGSVTVRALSRALRRNLGPPDPSPPKKHGVRKREPIPVAPFTPHDLRRTAATRMADAGVSMVLVPLVMGHKPRDITRRVYDRNLYLREKADALARWTRWLQRTLSAQTGPADVIPFPAPME